MPAPNGLAYPPVMRFSVVPKSVPFEIERPDPSGDPSLPPVVVTLRAWGRREVHPASVDIAVEAARDVYREARHAAQQQRLASPGADQFAPLTQAFMAWNADTLCAVIEDLQPEEAGLLASSAGPWEQILVALGWREPSVPEESADAEGEDGDDPEAVGEEPEATTDDSSPDSAPSTAPIRGAA